MKHNNKSLLILGKGDKEYNDRNAARFYFYAAEAGFDVKRADYSEIDLIQGFQNKTVYVMLFFPYLFWNAHCETLDDKELYGTSKRVYELFSKFFLDVKYKLEKRLSHNPRQLKYIINPEAAALDRDKIATHDILSLSSVPTTYVITSRNLSEIVDLITNERGVFIKCRYGAEGKGITLLRHNKWVTNYKVKDQVKDTTGNAYLGNYGVYDKWWFTDITGRVDLLEQLLEQEVIVEREIICPNIFQGEKFDARVYIVDGKAPHFFVRANNIDNVVTNYSQGAKVMHHPHTKLPKAYIDAAKREAVRAAAALQSRFMGIDVMFDGSPNMVKVVEAQTFTDFPDILRFDLIKYVITNSSLMG